MKNVNNHYFFFFLDLSNNNDNIKTTDVQLDKSVINEFKGQGNTSSIININDNIEDKSTLNKTSCASQNITKSDSFSAINNTKPISSDPSGNLKSSLNKNEIKIYDSEEEFEKNLPSTVTVLNTPFGSKVYLVGTAHFSEESQNDVSFVIQNVKPNIVMVELCPARIHILNMDEKTLLEETKNFNLAKVSLMRKIFKSKFLKYKSNPSL